MQPALVFLSVFVGILLLFWGLHFVSNWMYSLSKWILKKTGNSALAWNGPLALFLALYWVGYAAWVVHVYAHK